MNGCLALWLSGWYVIAHTPAVRAQNEISYSAAVLPRREGGIIRRFLFPSFPSHADFFFFSFSFSFHEKERKTLSSSLQVHLLPPQNFQTGLPQLFQLSRPIHTFAAIKTVDTFPLVM